MRLSNEEQEFLQLMALQLDETIRLLDRRQRQLEDLFGIERILELKGLWDLTLDIQDQDEMQRSMDSHERELLSVWARKERAHGQRLQVGKELMSRPLVSTSASKHGDEHGPFGPLGG